MDLDGFGMGLGLIWMGRKCRSVKDGKVHNRLRMNFIRCNDHELRKFSDEQRLVMTEMEFTECNPTKDYNH